MKKSRILGTILILSVASQSISCNKIKVQNTITADTTYYSVTTGSFERDKNSYMNIDIRIPKITYSNNEGSEIIDSLNTTIESNLNSLISEAKERALDTYNSYLKSAKDNAKQDIENKINSLKSKYESVLGETEIEILSNLDEVETVNGFTSTNDLIIPNLHNKNIIIVETTVATESSATNNQVSRPEIAPSEKSGDFQNFPRRASFSNAKRPPKNNDFHIEDDVIDDNAIKDDKVRDNLPPKNENISSSSNATLSEEITLENFYRDLSELKVFGIPDDHILTTQYTPTSIECNYEVKCLDEDYLSLFVELTESRTTSTIKRLFYNVDLNNKKIINIIDILGENYKETCIKHITEAIEKWDDTEKSKLIKDYNLESYINESTPFFINNNHRPVIEIEKFVITIGSAGYHEFQIP